MKKKVRIIAFYLPQYHPIPENDKWWGKGFTEWTNVGKAKPLFKGHYQPRLPSELGYYDLRVPETREAQAEMAKENGVEGFCYWHYWFGNGKQLLERPFNEVLASGKPDFPFCLAWANDPWHGFDHGLKNRNLLIEQLYPGTSDYINHFYSILPAFKDSRYIKVDNKPLFMIYKPLGNKDVKLFIEVWRDLALKNGLEGIHFVGQNTDFNVSNDDIFGVGVDAVNTVNLNRYYKQKLSVLSKLLHKIKKYIFGFPIILSYQQMSKMFLIPEIDVKENIYPSVIPNWDHSPRSGKDALVLTNSTPKLFEKHFKEALELVVNKKDEHKIIFIKSWNEWAEGNYIEPDIKFGNKYLQVLKKNILL